MEVDLTERGELAKVCELRVGNGRMPALLLNFSRLKQAIALTKPLKQAPHAIAELKQAIALTKPLNRML
jgi:hypothetical protein